jgi:hypothetical protein
MKVLIVSFDRSLVKQLKGIIPRESIEEAKRILDDILKEMEGRK